MDIKSELLKERKELLFLTAEVHSEHKEYDKDHQIGKDDKCSVCRLFMKIQHDNKRLNEKLKILENDANIIQAFKELESYLGYLPTEKEFKQSKEAIKQFGTWNNFLYKVTRF